MPVYQLNYKVLVDGKEVNTISSYDFAVVKYRIRRLNKGNEYCVLNQYPYPKIEEGYLFAILEGSLVRLQKVFLLLLRSNFQAGTNLLENCK